MEMKRNFIWGSSDDKKSNKYDATDMEAGRLPIYCKYTLMYNIKDNQRQRWQQKITFATGDIEYNLCRMFRRCYLYEENG